MWARWPGGFILQTCVEWALAEGTEQAERGLKMQEARVVVVVGIWAGQHLTTPPREI